MKAQICRWFVLPSGDDVNNIISINFHDATFQELIHVGTDSKPKPAWEVDLETIGQLLEFLRSSHIDGKLLVAVQEGDAKIRMADRTEFDSRASRVADRQEQTNRIVAEKAGKSSGTFVPSATSFH